MIYINSAMALLSITICSIVNAANLPWQERLKSGESIIDIYKDYIVAKDPDALAQYLPLSIYTGGSRPVFLTIKAEDKKQYVIKCDLDDGQIEQQRRVQAHLPPKLMELFPIIQAQHGSCAVMSVMPGEVLADYICKKNLAQIEIIHLAVQIFQLNRSLAQNQVWFYDRNWVNNLPLKEEACGITAIR